MQASFKYIFLVAAIIAVVLVDEGFSFLNGPCKKKRWSKCNSVRFQIMKRADSPLSDKYGDVITKAEWKELLRRRVASNTRQELLQVLKDLKADIVAEIEIKNET